MKLSLTPDWPHALAVWRETGQTNLIEQLILTGEPVPEDCRQLLADLIGGRAKRPRGNPHARTPLARIARNAGIRIDYDEMRAADTPAAIARQILAEKYHLSAAAIDSIIRRRT